jgi:epoxyqueuosine reductase
LQHADSHTAFVKQSATELGFDYCGIAKAKLLDEDAKRLERWLSKGFHGSMKYMENHFDKRVDPTKLVPDARSVITLLLNYFPAEKQNEDSPRIAKYAWGKDYHEVIREKLNLFLYRLREKFGAIEGRGFVDSAPVLERSWANQSGLGWIGKNGNFIHPKAGSFYFIATLITDLELNYDSPFTKDYCGSCTRCIEACPTEAILPDKVIDGSKCISYYTIELKELLMPEAAKGKMDNWLFGCDTCQDVCPWNRFSKPHQLREFKPLPEILEFSTSQWEEMTEESFKTIFKESPIKRSKYQGIRRNLRMIKDN